MRILVLVVLLGGVAHADRTHTRLHYTDAAIALLTQKCAKTSAWWCKATHWDAGTAESLPLARPLVGLAITTGEPGQKVRTPTTITGGDMVVGCIVTGTADHPQIWLGELATDDASIAEVTRALAGKKPRAKLSATLGEVLRAHAGEHPLTQVDDEWYWDDGSDDMRLRKIDGVWVVILAPPPAAARAYPDSRTVFVLTDAWD